MSRPIRITFDVDNGHWTASPFEQPKIAFGGNSEHVAVCRLLDAMGWADDTLELFYDSPQTEAAANTHRATFLPSTVCPDCGGGGLYRGLNAMELCKKCGGTGDVCD